MLCYYLNRFWVFALKSDYLWQLGNDIRVLTPIAYYIKAENQFFIGVLLWPKGIKRGKDTIATPNLKKKNIYDICIFMERWFLQWWRENQWILLHLSLVCSGEKNSLVCSVLLLSLIKVHVGMYMCVCVLWKRERKR